MLALDLTRRSAEVTWRKCRRAAFDRKPAEYDIDAVEAHVADLVDQGWPSNLRPYAVAIAEGLNALADPSGFEEITADDFRWRSEFDLEELEKLADSVAQRFMLLAGIPVAEQEFRSRANVIFKNWVLCRWREVSREGNERYRAFVDCLRKTRISATALNENLEALSLYVKEIDRAELAGIDDQEPDSGVLMYLMPSVIARMRRYLPQIIDGIRLLIEEDEPQGRGRPSGRREYPGLKDLVFELEYEAYFAGGGFGIPNKKLKKGRLIEALNFMRETLCDSVDWAWLAKFLPAPGEHPVSVYENALIRFYKRRIPVDGMRGLRIDLPGNWILFSG
jgi:hypothetical protein